MDEKKTYSREFRLEAIRLSETSGKSIAEVWHVLTMNEADHWADPKNSE